MKSIDKITIKEIIELMDSVDDKNICFEDNKIFFHNVDISKYKKYQNKLCEMYYCDGTLFLKNKEIFVIKKTSDDKKFGMLYQYLLRLKTYMIFEYKTKYIENSFIGANI